MSNLSSHSSYFGKDKNDTDYYYYQLLYQHIQCEDKIQNQNTEIFHLPNESYYSSLFRRDSNHTNCNYYQYLKQCLQTQHMPQNKYTVPFQTPYNSFRSSLSSFNQNQKAITKVLVSTTTTQNQVLPTIHQRRHQSFSRSSYENNRTVSTVTTEKFLHNKASSQGKRSFGFMTASSDNDDEQLPSISAMREYSDKSFEKLRLEDNKYTYKKKIARSNDDKKEINDDHLCVVCLEEEKTIVYLPCFHMCTCKKCGMKDSLTKCPICRSSIDCKEKVFW